MTESIAASGLGGAVGVAVGLMLPLWDWLLAVWVWLCT
jgi:hypothetical protein